MGMIPLTAVGLPADKTTRIWQLFIRSVTVIRGYLSYETAYKRQFQRILWKFAEDGIQYAEIRVALNYGFFITSDDGEKTLRHREALQLLKETQDEELPKIQQQYDFVGVRIIYAVMRNATREAMAWSIDNCIAMKQEFPSLICGKLMKLNVVS
jgi:adenosine deaminase CECR1